MFLINKSYLQVIFLYLISFTIRKKTFYIIHYDKPGFIFRNFIKVINNFSTICFKLKTVNFLRDKYRNLSDQRSINKISDYFKKLSKGSTRSGGQIYLENSLRLQIWENVVVDEMFDFYFKKKNPKKRKIIYIYFSIISKIRSLERSLIQRFSILRNTLSFQIYIFDNILKERFLKDKNTIIDQTLYSTTIHDFDQVLLNLQQQDLILDTVDLLSKHKKIENILNEKKFVSVLIYLISKKISLISLVNLTLIVINLIKNFFLSKSFFQNASNSIDSFTEILIKEINFSKDFKILFIDPAQGRSIPFLTSIMNKGYEVYFTSFSLGNCYTKSCSDYNGPYSTILSPHEGFTQLAKKSGFKGKIKNIKCYMTLANERIIQKDKSPKRKQSISKIIVPESSPKWFFSLSERELIEFTEILYCLKSKHNFELFVKKKKSISEIEDYLISNYPSHKIKFLPEIRGYMVDFFDKDFILSSGISSIAIKSAEKFKIPYIIFDAYNNSFNEWKLIYSNTSIKPMFAKNIDEIIAIIKTFEKK